MDAQAKQVKNTHINKQIFQNEFAKKLTRLSHSNNNNTTASTTTATSATTAAATLNVRDKLLDTLLFRSCSRCHAPLTRRAGALNLFTICLFVFVFAFSSSCLLHFMSIPHHHHHHHHSPVSLHHYYYEQLFSCLFLLHLQHCRNVHKIVWNFSTIIFFYFSIIILYQADNPIILMRLRKGNLG